MSSLVWVALSYFLTSFESNTETLVAATALLTHKDQLVLTGTLLPLLVGLTERLVWSTIYRPLCEHYNVFHSLLIPAIALSQLLLPRDHLQIFDRQYFASETSLVV